MTSLETRPGGRHCAAQRGAFIPPEPILPAQCGPEPTHLRPALYPLAEIARFDESFWGWCARHLQCREGIAA